MSAKLVAQWREERGISENSKRTSAGNGKLQRARMNSRPSITEVVGRYVNLRRAGKEWRGLCPFHSEKTPSFTVNEEKGVYHCFGCGESGDVITFIQKIEGVDFKGALAHLGLADGTMPRTKPQKSIERQAAEIITAWASDMSLKISARMRVLGHGLSDGEPTESYCERQWAILEMLDQDLANPQLLMELRKQRESVEAIINA